MEDAVRDRNLGPWVLALGIALACSCGGEEAEDPPPPVQPLPTPGVPTPGVPTPGVPTPGVPTPGVPTPGQPVPGMPMPGQPTPGMPLPGQPIAGTVAVTIMANSTPAGATVLRPTGEVLGTTPLVSQVNLPADQVGLPQTFTFNLTGYQPATATAVAVNNAIQVDAALMPMGGGMMPTGVPRTITAHGGGGGAIFDFHTTTAHANVGEPCIIQSMTVNVRGHHTFYADLVVSLRGPNGQSASLHRRGRGNPFRTHSVTRVIGTQAQGGWTLSVRDEVRADAGQLSGFSMTLTCM
jgi:hypothetical protein